MLVLTRKKREQIFIGDDIVVKVIRVSGESVRLGIEAPRGVNVQREEVAIAHEKPDGKYGP